MPSGSITCARFRNEVDHLFVLLYCCTRAAAALTLALSRCRRCHPASLGWWWPARFRPTPSGRRHFHTGAGETGTWPTGCVLARAGRAGAAAAAGPKFVAVLACDPTALYGTSRRRVGAPRTESAEVAICYGRCMHPWCCRPPGWRVTHRTRSPLVHLTTVRAYWYRLRRGGSIRRPTGVPAAVRPGPGRCRLGPLRCGSSCREVPPHPRGTRPVNPTPPRA